VGAPLLGRRLTMRVEGDTVYLKPEEVSKACPRNLAWIAGVIANWGLDAASKNDRLRAYSRVPAVLEKAGYRVVIEEEKTPGPKE